MFHELDRHTIESITRLGANDFPTNLEPTYNSWLQAKHRCIGSAELGPTLCVALCGHLGLLKEPAPEVATPILDWSLIDQGTAIQIKEADGSILYGAYRGKTGPGRIAVELIGDEYVQEFAQRKVTMRGAEVEPAPQEEDKPEPTELGRTGVDWGSIPNGTPVLVDSVEGDVMLGKFTSVGKHGQLLVAISGDDEPIAYDQEQIALGE